MAEEFLVLRKYFKPFWAGQQRKRVLDLMGVKGDDVAHGEQKDETIYHQEIIFEAL